MKPWSKEETDFLIDKWGLLSKPAIAARLGRSCAAITVRSQRLGLGSVLNAGDYVTMHQLFRALGCGASGSYKNISWTKNRGFPVHMKRVEKNQFKVVYLEEFWEWAADHRSFIDFSKMEPLALGKEPEWVAEQRKKDWKANSLHRKDPWTPFEDKELVRLLKLQRYGYAEMSAMLHRSTGAIQGRCFTLGIKDRPVKADNHNPWTEAEFETLAAGIRSGESYGSISAKLGRSEKAIRGRVYTAYFTEDIDKVRAMMGSESWGSGAPAPTVKQALCLSSYRKETRDLLSGLVTTLRVHMNELGFEPYFQKDMCMKWDDVKGCTAGCDNCDECIEFQRIKPQYCVRCGATFLERKPNKHCQRCRKTRKQQYARMWSATKGSR